MTATIGAYIGFAVALIGAITALITAFRAKSSAAIANGIAAHANNKITDHINREVFPIQPPTEQETPDVKTND